MNRRSASASVATDSDSDMHWKSSGPVRIPSDIMISAPLIRTLACMILSVCADMSIPDGGGSGLSLKRIIMRTSAPSLAL